jgi:hypothetical protein
MPADFTEKQFPKVISVLLEQYSAVYKGFQWDV